MAEIREMPRIPVPADLLREWGQVWQRRDPAKNKDKEERFTKKDGMGFGRVFDAEVGEALAVMLGDLPIAKPRSNDLLPSQKDCVEVGDCRVIGGIRPQNFDVCYRPDGARIVFDSKTLNQRDSIRKNYQNMINDLATEATTVHTRFPYAVVGFMVIIPSPILAAQQRSALIRTLERLSQRSSPLDSVHRAEVISFVLWNPADGSVVSEWPPPDSCLRLETFSEQLHRVYLARYKGLPPHDREG